MLYCPSVDHASFFTVWGSTWLMVNQKKDDQGPFILVIFSSYWCISILYFCHILEGNTSNSSDTTFRYLLSNFSPDKGLRGEDLVHAGGDDDVLLPEEPLLVPRPVHQPEVTGNRIIQAVTAVTKLSYKLSPEIESSQDRKQNYYLLMPALLWSNSAALKHLNLWENKCSKIWW